MQLFRSLISVSIVLFFCNRFVTAQESSFIDRSQSSPFKTSSKDLVSAITTKSWYQALAETPQSQSTNTHPKGLWAGSRFKSDISISEVKLKFLLNTKMQQPPSEVFPALSGDISPESFNFDLTVKKNRLYFTHSTGSDKSSRYFSIQLGDSNLRRPFQYYVEGLGDSDLYLIVPAIRSASQRWGLSICPRTKRASFSSASKDRIDWSFSQSAYQLNTVAINVSGQADLVMETAFQHAEASLKILQSPGLPASLVSEQSDQSTDPRLGLKYAPIAPLGEISFSPESGFYEGLKFLGSFRRKSGYLKQVSYQRGVAIDTLDKTPLELVNHQGRPVLQDLGSCYILTLFQSSKELFSKN